MLQSVQNSTVRCPSRSCTAGAISKLSFIGDQVDSCSVHQTVVSLEQCAGILLSLWFTCMASPIPVCGKYRKKSHIFCLTSSGAITVETSREVKTIHIPFKLGRTTKPKGAVGVQIMSPSGEMK